MRVLIAGGGEVGTLIASRLANEGNDVSIVDANVDRCLHLQDFYTMLVILAPAFWRR